MKTLEYLQTQGAEITLLPVDPYGLINLENLKSSIKKNTILISIMLANDEIGTIQPIEEIGIIAKENKILFHTDAAQAIGHLPIDVYQMNIDLLSFSAHKFYGPKGIGALVVRSFSPRVELEPIIYGGGQERNLRSGTLNVPGIVGLSEALQICKKEMKNENQRLKKLSQKIFNDLKIEFPEIKLNGDPEKRLAHNLNITIPGIEAKALIHLLKNKLSFSTGSACSTVKAEPSYVLKTIGLSDEECFQTIRIGLGRFVSENMQISEILINAIKEIIKLYFCENL